MRRYRCPDSAAARTIACATVYFPAPGKPTRCTIAGPATTGSALDLELVAGSQVPVRERAGRGLDDAVGLEHRTTHAPAAHPDRPQHSHLAVDERDVDGEPHPERVHR